MQEKIAQCLLLSFAQENLISVLSFRELVRVIQAGGVSAEQPIVPVIQYKKASIIKRQHLTCRRTLLHCISTKHTADHFFLHLQTTNVHVGVLYAHREIVYSKQRFLLLATTYSKLPVYLVAR